MTAEVFVVDSERKPSSPMLFLCNNIVSIEHDHKGRDESLQ